MKKKTEAENDWESGNQQWAEELARLAGGAFRVLSGLKKDMGSDAKDRVELWAQRMGFVTRAEFDGALAMLAKARLQQEELLERIEKLEGKKSTRQKAKKQ